MLSRARHAMLLTTLALSALAACGSTEEAEPAEADAITAGQLVAGDSPYYWANVSFEQHLRGLALLVGAKDPGGNFQAAYPPASDPLQQRLQAWADRLDVAMRARTGNRTAPKPQVKVLRSSSAYNAYAAGTLVPLGASLGAATAQASTSVPLLYSAGGAVNILPSMPNVTTAGLKTPTEWNRLASFTQVWNLNNKNGDGCSLSASGTQLTASGAKCQGTAVKAPEVLVLAESPYITVSSDFAATVPNEPEMIFALAHELGHMYRAHQGVLTTRKYGFWYEQGPKVSKRPVASAESAALGTQYQSFQRTHFAYEDIQGAVLAPRARALPLLLNAYTEVATAGAPGVAGLGLTACPGYSSWKSASADFTSAASAQAQTPSPKFSAAYLSLEKVVLACPTTLKFSATTPGSEPSLLSTVFFSLFQNPMGTAPSLPLMPSDGQTLVDYVAKARQLAATLAAGENAFVTKLNANHIGLYTTEQEADEVAAELMIRAGFSRDEVLAAFAGTLRVFETKLSSSGKSLPVVPAKDTGNASYATCNAWLQKGFVDAAGAPIVMTLGDIADPHHGNCYRLYNLWRESATHSYAPGPKQAQLTPAWSTLVDHAKQLTTQAAAQGL